jgi:hypothetical protein
MNPLQEQFFDRSYANTLTSLGINLENEKTAGFFGNLIGKFKGAPATPGKQMSRDVASAAKANEPKWNTYKKDPMADVAKAHHSAKKQNVDLNKLYTGQSTTGSIADQLPREKPVRPEMGAWDKAKDWWGDRSPWAKAGIGAAAALPIAGGLYAAGGMNAPRPQQQPPQQY